MDIIALRRDFHKHPEVGFTEFRTASKVVEILQSFGCEVLYGQDAIDGASRRGMPSESELEAAYERALRDGANPEIVGKMRGGYTAVIGVLRGTRPGPTVGFRFDMDALPIRESADSDHIPQAGGFRSIYEGNMHSCGHDGHTAIGLGLAQRLSDRNFSGTVKIIFQPAEESVRGAYAIVQKGILDDVDYFFSHHLVADMPLGEVHGGTEGLLASTKMAVHFHGVASHAGVTPEKGRNALLGAATALLNIHAITRFSAGSTRVNVGVLEGGIAANIIPSYAKMLVETRSVSGEANEELERRVRTIIEHSAAMHELQVEIEVFGQATTIACDQELVDIAVEEAHRMKGFTSIKNYGEKSITGSEDVTLMVKRVQERGGKGTNMLIGADYKVPHHHPKFDIHEDVLPLAVELFERVARRMLVKT